MKTTITESTLKITSGNANDPIPHDTAYAAALVATEHRTRHQAIDIGAKHARANQRALASFVNRLAKLLARDWAGHELRIQGHALKGYTSPCVECQIIKDNTIQRVFVVQYYYAIKCRVVVESHHYPRPGSPINSSVRRDVDAGCHAVTSCAARAIKATPFITYESEK